MHDSDNGPNHHGDPPGDDYGTAVHQYHHDGTRLDDNDRSARHQYDLATHDGCGYYDRPVYFDVIKHEYERAVHDAASDHDDIPFHRWAGLRAR